jgi:2-hydroxy-3-keto-5-methylthiopentenyl-1-phosphate phosphatase
MSRLPALPPEPALFFDFDNTLTQGDLLDALIEAYSPNEAWREWERAWTAGEMAASECLRLQVENLCVSREALLEHLGGVRIDPAFAQIVAWARRHDAPLAIVSDSFVPLIEQVLRANGVDGVAIFANELEFGAQGRLSTRFPFCDPQLPRSANAKARHLAPYRGLRSIVFAGDGRSDLDAALAADVVFAKALLAEEMAALGLAFRPFATLDAVLAFLEAA